VSFLSASSSISIIDLLAAGVAGVSIKEPSVSLSFFCGVGGRESISSSSFCPSSSGDKEMARAAIKEPSVSVSLGGVRGRESIGDDTVEDVEASCKRTHSDVC
jgi:hypothetical protein